MSWSPDVVTRKVTGRYITFRGNPAKGTVSFAPSARVLDADDAVLIESPIVARFDGFGEFEVEIPTTDNPLLKPSSWAYQVTIRVNGVRPRQFWIKLPYGDGSPVDLFENDLANLTGEPLSETSNASGQRGSIGPQGSTGPTGPTGPQGPPRLVAYHHIQGASSSEWRITHDLDFYPNVTTMDSVGTIVEGELEHISENELVVTFALPFTGEAFLS